MDDCRKKEIESRGRTGSCKWIYRNHSKHTWNNRHIPCLFCTWKSDALFCGLTLKEPPLNEVEFIEDTPSARFLVEILMEGPSKLIFKAKASIVFRALKREIKIIPKTEYRKNPTHVLHAPQITRWSSCYWQCFYHPSVYSEGDC